MPYSHPTCRNGNPSYYADKGSLHSSPSSWASFSLRYGRPYAQPSVLSIIHSVAGTNILSNLEAQTLRYLPKPTLLIM